MIFDLSKMLALPDTLLKTKSYFNKYYSILRVDCAKKKRKKNQCFPSLHHDKTICFAGMYNVHIYFK